MKTREAIETVLECILIDTLKQFDVSPLHALTELESSVKTVLEADFNAVEQEFRSEWQSAAQRLYIRALKGDYDRYKKPKANHG